jgi:uncharacterized protein (DUF302 family)
MKKVIIFLVAFLSVVSLHARGDLHIFTVDNKDGKITSEVIEKAFEKAGFTIGINSNIAEGLGQKYGDKMYTIYNAVSMYHPKHTMEMIKKNANAGVFAPMGVSIYQLNGESNLHVAILTAETQAKMIGSDIKLTKPLEDAILKVMKATLPKAKHSYSKKSLKADRELITKYERAVDSAEYKDAREELEEKLEESLEPYGFVMPSYFDLTESLGKDSPFNFMATYSICKIDVIYAVSRTRPEAAAFAPCTTMVYKKKNEDKIVFGFSSVFNWMSSATIVDQASKDALMQAQNDFEAILGAVTK